MNLIKEIKQFQPYYCGCLDGISILGEEEFSHCYSFSCGIGDLEWWVDFELNKLNEDQLIRLLFILKRNYWINNNIIIHDIIKWISENDIRCETYQIYRLGKRVCYELIKDRIKKFKYFKDFPLLPEIFEITENHIKNINLNENMKNLNNKRKLSIIET